MPETSDPRVKQMYRWLSDLRAASGTRGALLGVILDGKVIHLGAQGYERGEGCEPMTLSSSYYLVTALHTALALGIAQKQGLVDLDATVDVPGLTLAGDWPYPTLAQLVGQAGGIPRTDQLTCDQQGGDASLDALVRGTWARWAAPGEARYFSLWSLAAAGRALELATGRSFETATREDLIQPLSLSLSWDEQSVTLGSSEDAALGDICPFEQPSIVLATIGDVVRMLQLALDGGEGLVDAATLDRLFDEGLADDYDPAPFSNGLVLERLDTPQGPLYWQSSYLGGSSTILLVAERERKLGIVLVLNSSSLDVSTLVSEILGIWGRTLPRFDDARTTHFEDYAGTFDITVPGSGPDSFTFGIPDDVYWTRRMWMEIGKDPGVDEVVPATAWPGMRPLDVFASWRTGYRFIFRRDATGKVVSLTTPFTPPYVRRAP